MTPENDRLVSEWEGSAWYPAIKHAADQLTDLCPKIKFDQIKAKFGGLRFYYTIPQDLAEEDLPTWTHGKRELLERYAEEIVTYAMGWVDGYEKCSREVLR